MNVARTVAVYQIHNEIDHRLIIKLKLSYDVDD